MSQEEIFINGDLLRLRREAKGWVLGDMATRACMSVKQIRQLEEGGLSAYYSQAVKVTAAKKVGALLGLTSEEVFAHPAVETTASDLDSIQESAQEMAPVVVSEFAPSSAQVETSTDDGVFDQSEPMVASIDQPAIAEDTSKKSKTSLWLIAGLFVAALLVAAYMQPHDEPVSAEPPPPLQVVPADAVEAASAADGVASSASTEAASMPKLAASSSVPVASAVKSAASAGSAPIVSRVPAVTPAPASPASAAASKAP